MGFHNRIGGFGTIRGRYELNSMRSLSGVSMRRVLGLMRVPQPHACWHNQVRGEVRLIVSESSRYGTVRSGLLTSSQVKSGPVLHSSLCLQKED